ncbi:MAG: efflux RND transporter periplasmic adaptor subunit [Sedimentisphaerales bacterium]|nr:efflux RND transporter periplasmic adaptor subunit [Sedimentisphaerales bacterium]
MKKLVMGVLAVAVLGALGWEVYRRVTTSGNVQAGGRGAMAVAVEIQPVRRGEIRDVAVFTGSLLPKSQFVVAPKVSGWLKQLLVHVGDTVQRNGVIAIIDDAEFTQQVEQARAEWQVAKANVENSASNLDMARREYDRAKALREKQIASASELDEAEATFNARQAQLKVSEAQVAQREAALKAAELRLSYSQVRAFWEGGDEARVVGERFVDEGALLQVNEAIVSVLEIDPLTGVVYVIERDYPKVRVGQQAVITTDAYPDQSFVGNIVRIAPLLRESSRQARVEIEVPNSEQWLRPGMFVRARVEFARQTDATLVPLAALVKRDGRDGVFVADTAERKARFVPVTIGIVENETAEIVETQDFASLLAGPVITMGNHLLEDESSIVIPNGEGPQEKKAEGGNAPETRRAASPGAAG